MSKHFIDLTNQEVDFFDAIRHSFTGNATSTTRRGFMAAATGLLAMPQLASAASDVNFSQWQREVLSGSPRTLWLSRSTKAGMEVVTPQASMYWHPSQPTRLQGSGYARVCDLLRDVKSDRVTEMDIHLLDSLVLMQRWLAYSGVNKPLRITSGFRTAAHNQSIEGAARNSKHVQGEAVDFWSQEMDALTLARMGAILGRGGVGFYPNRNFVHLDSGEVRRWGKRAYDKM